MPNKRILHIDSEDCKLIKAISHIRVSTKNQVKNVKYKVLDNIHELSSRDIQIVDTFIEGSGNGSFYCSGKSLKREDRPDLYKLLQLASETGIGIFSRDIDRLYRTPDSSRKRLNKDERRALEELLDSFGVTVYLQIPPPAPTSVKRSNATKQGMKYGKKKKGRPSKITPSIKRKVESMIDKGYGYRTIRKELGISLGLISKIKDDLGIILNSPPPKPKPTKVASRNVLSWLG